jgi:UDP-2,3-diacylglucosamine hydrolase
MRKTYFFSDAHLGLGSKEDDRTKERALLNFLDHVARDGEQLFIVGDLFDYWFEYKTVVPKGYFRLFTKLADLTEQGVAISYIAGNHDFWLRGYFHDELGIELFRDPLERTIHGKRFYIHHGDGLLKNDIGYRILKRILRSTINIFLFSLLHPDWAGSLARWSSRRSRRHTGKRHFENDGMISFAEKKLSEGFDVVVMGHHHSPLLRNTKEGIYVNLGDWITEYTYAVYNGRTVQLKRWKQ